MAEFIVNPERIDPYKNFRFRVKWDARYVAGISRIAGLRSGTEVIASPAKFSPIVLERGMTHDSSFQMWVNQATTGFAQGGESSLNVLRQDVRIESFNEAGELVEAWDVFRCWPSEYQPLADLDGNANAVIIGHLKLENEGWARDAPA
ncbi:phage tail protein [Mycolicibacterium peregrinum]|uniref:Phage tail protein n=1 Tax=Mycolicibacterium peregrinum TaxID=43304 RepID=A0A1A0VWB5_MYCPR|nr:phage tail protein [Mycolicibacterium peregrinum]OBB87486.1 hypothetical protein A5779_01475 [Mycolicibacterium peregrinum]